MKDYPSIPSAIGQQFREIPRGYVDLVRKGVIDGITHEGVVAKAGEKHDIVRAKAKTQRWIDAVIAAHGELAGKKLIES